MRSRVVDLEPWDYALSFAHEMVIAPVLYALVVGIDWQPIEYIQVLLALFLQLVVNRIVQSRPVCITSVAVMKLLPAPALLPHGEVKG